MVCVGWCGGVRARKVALCGLARSVCTTAQRRGGGTSPVVPFSFSGAGFLSAFHVGAARTLDAAGAFPLHPPIIVASTGTIQPHPQPQQDVKGCKGVAVGTCGTTGRGIFATKPFKQGEAVIELHSSTLYKAVYASVKVLEATLQTCSPAEVRCSFCAHH
jgi:hypothetical protein